MPTNARRRHRIGTGGPWGTGLLFLGIAITLQGVAYTAPGVAALPPALVQLGQTVPIVAWGVLWVAAGIYSIYQALTPPQRHVDVWAAAAVTALWSGAYLIYWAALVINDGDWTRSWTGGIAWGSLSAVIVCLGKCVNPPRSDGE